MCFCDGNTARAQSGSLWFASVLEVPLFRPDLSEVMNGNQAPGLVEVAFIRVRHDAINRVIVPHVEVRTHDVSS